jgi:hypothetical protein
MAGIPIKKAFTHFIKRRKGPIGGDSNGRDELFVSVRNTVDRVKELRVSTKDIE